MPMVSNIAIGNEKNNIFVMGGETAEKTYSNKIQRLKCENGIIDEQNCEWDGLELKLKVPRAWGVAIPMP